MIRETVIILCGGKGRRLGSLAERLPKVLAPVHDRPILWYVLMRLHQEGFRHFVLPLGYLGNEIRKFFERDLSGLGARVDLIETGEDTPVGTRLSLVRHAIDSEDFLLVNGDTLFDFDIADMLARHRADRADLTLTSCRIISQYGLLLVDDAGRVVDFVRDSMVNEFVVDTRGRQSGFINAGIAVLRRRTLDTPGVDSTPEFEQYLYPRIIASGAVRHHAINGFWHAIDTQKDLEVANSSTDSDPRALGVRLLANKLRTYAAERQLA